MRVTIVGCGYLGLALGERLAADGHDAAGVRRSEKGLEAVADAGIEPVRADVTDPGSLDALPDADAVVFAASAGGRDADAARTVYVDGLRAVVSEYGSRADPPDRLLYASSTGVYGDRGGDWVDEETPIEPGTDRERVLADAERVATDEAAAAGIDGTAVRFGGIYGPGRFRVERYLRQPVTEGYLNVVHRVDAAAVLRFLLAEDHRPEVLVAVDDEPVWKPDFAAWLAGQCGTDPPPTRTREAYLAETDHGESRRRRVLASKRCSNERLRALGYDRLYPTIRDGYREAVAEWLVEH